jgi:hypothetical protein
MKRVWAFLKRDWQWSFRLSKQPEILPPFRNTINFAVAQQIIILVMTSLILDGGDSFRICGVAALAFWAGVGTIRFRRQIPTKGDIIFIKGVYLPLCFLSGFECM